MTNVVRHYIGYAQEGQYIRQVAAELGITPQQVFSLSEDGNIFRFLTSADLSTPGHIYATFLGGMTMDVTYQPASLTVTRVAMTLNGQLAFEWTGNMSAELFLADEWPETQVYGSSNADLLWVENGTAYAGAGNDIVEIGGSGIAYGGAGADAFVIAYASHGGNIRIADYQVGEKIYFEGFQSFEQLAAGFQGVSAASSNGFNLHFAQPDGAHWSLSIQGASLEQMRLEDLLVGQAGADLVYAPVRAAFGIV